eukprot:CAMPEP_0175813628 /NCGR_PEP_ID=MMETSP0107_2-20121207/4997_1 /TAXON_ID=195067 ORGANISM="Goniomonas pacifica, Strain CCMP1869" /NCGR_SAMPLE_ID=MMETSP0107_2 /ASSEMBLY_ACC=CAM_ASM_000203 /LENGTH=543 /DNA_ID=CAMNT_0017125541 /DNA_START=17 /DNA_END=1645 /DNA_ORIENTATION=-
MAVFAISAPTPRHGEAVQPPVTSTPLAPPSPRLGLGELQQIVCETLRVAIEQVGKEVESRARVATVPEIKRLSQHALHCVVNAVVDNYQQHLAQKCAAVDKRRERERRQEEKRKEEEVERQRQEELQRERDQARAEAMSRVNAFATARLEATTRAKLDKLAREEAEVRARAEARAAADAAARAKARKAAQRRKQREQRARLEELAQEREQEEEEARRVEEAAAAARAYREQRRTQRAEKRRLRKAQEDAAGRERTLPNHWPLPKPETGTAQPEKQDSDTSAMTSTDMGNAVDTEALGLFVKSSYFCAVKTPPLPAKKWHSKHTKDSSTKPSRVPPTLTSIPQQPPAALPQPMPQPEQVKLVVAAALSTSSHSPKPGPYDLPIAATVAQLLRDDRRHAEQKDDAQAEPERPSSTERVVSVLNAIADTPAGRLSPHKLRRTCYDAPGTVTAQPPSPTMRNTSRLPKATSILPCISPTGRSSAVSQATAWVAPRRAPTSTVGSAEPAQVRTAWPREKWNWPEFHIPIDSRYTPSLSRCQRQRSKSN